MNLATAFDPQYQTMAVPFDVVAEGPYLCRDFVGAKRIMNEAELATWVGPTRDLAVWHRCLQIDFKRSTVIGISAGYRTGAVHPISVTSMQYRDNELRVEFKEDKTREMAVTLSQHLRPFQIVKCLNTGDARIFFNVKQ